MHPANPPSASSSSRSVIHTPVGTKEDVEAEIETLRQNLAIKKVEKENEFIQKMYKKTMVSTKSSTLANENINNKPAPPMPLDGDIMGGSYGFVRNCVSCHGTTIKDTIAAPALALILGKKAGSSKTFSGYSNTLIKANFIWSDRNLYAFIKNPQKVIPGVKCEIPGGGIEDDRERADIVKFIKSFNKEMHKYVRGQANKTMGKEYVDNQIVTMKYMGMLKKDRVDKIS